MIAETERSNLFMSSAVGGTVVFAAITSRDGPLTQPIGLDEILTASGPSATNFDPPSMGNKAIVF
jgi:hypothetical protein